jgi:hypothetical protein
MVEESKTIADPASLLTDATMTGDQYIERLLEGSSTKQAITISRRKDDVLAQAIV